MSNNEAGFLFVIMILVTGFPYVRERYFATWLHIPHPEQYRFLLPGRWTAKKGKVVFHPPKDKRITTTKTFFPDSHAPLIGGLLKGWMPAFPAHLWRMRKKVDLVYACSEPTLLSTLYFGLFTKLLGKKLVLFTWENIPYEKKFRGLSRLIHSWLLAMNLWLSDGLICGNPESLAIHSSFAIRHLPFRKPLFAVIPMNGVDADFFNPTHYSLSTRAFREYDFSGKIVFTFIGAIGYRKGIHVAVQALAGVLKKIPNAHLVIAGSGEYEEELQEQIEQSGVSEHVMRVSWLADDEVRSLLAVSDVFLYPSIPYGGWAEQFGYSMVEASLMGLPVISTRSGSISHVVRHEETGLLVSANDEGALADAMIRLGSERELRSNLGREGRIYVVEHFSHDTVARSFSSFFEELLA